MTGTATPLLQPLAYRVWDPRTCSYFYTDVLPQDSCLLERWTGRFDKQGSALYENDIIRVHYDWKLGWVRALIVRQGKDGGYYAQATTPEGTTLQIGFYSFDDAYRIGNIRENPKKLVTATEQFPTEKGGEWWLSSAVFRPVSRSCFN
jgi:hypothetical protein